MLWPESITSVSYRAICLLPMKSPGLQAKCRLKLQHIERSPAGTQSGPNWRLPWRRLVLHGHRPVLRLRLTSGNLPHSSSSLSFVLLCQSSVLTSTQPKISLVMLLLLSSFGLSLLPFTCVAQLELPGTTAPPADCCSVLRQDSFLHH